MSQPDASEDSIDDTVEASFPASDPPEWTGVHAGSPDGNRPHPDREAPAVPGLRSLRVALGVGEAMDRVERAVSSAGMKVFARIDQAAEARAVGLSMPAAQLLIFGSPRAGTPVMVARPTTAIDLPLKALVWEGAGGETWLSYNDTAAFAERHGVPADLAAKLAAVGPLLEQAVTS